MEMSDCLKLRDGLSRQFLVDWGLEDVTLVGERRGDCGVRWPLNILSFDETERTSAQVDLSLSGCAA